MVRSYCKNKKNQAFISAAQKEEEEEVPFPSNTMNCSSFFSGKGKMYLKSIITDTFYQPYSGKKEIKHLEEKILSGSS